MLQSDAFVSKCNSSTLVLKNKIERITFTYESIALKHAEDDYAWLNNHTVNEQLNECMFFSK